MKHVFTKDDLIAMRKAVDSLGGQSEVARRAGLNQPSSLNKYINGSTQTCNVETWEKLFKVIEEYYPGFQHNTVSETTADKLVSLTDILGELAPGKQIITGVLNLSGVPAEKIRKAIADAKLTEEQRRDLIFRIFG